MVKLEVCIDSLESALNAIHGGAEELEVCSSLAEGGLTPSVGLVNKILCLVKKIGTGVLIHHSCSECKCPELTEKPRVNIMIRCRAGSDFCYTPTEVETMLTDLAVMKNMGVDRFVFGALTSTQDIDKETCAKVITKANPLPVTFHRAYDVCKNTLLSLETIIDLGFDRLLTSGQRPSVEDPDAYKMISDLMALYKDKIQIMPGAGINVNNVQQYVLLGCPMIHCSCKAFRVPKIQKTLNMSTEIASAEKIYYTDQNSVIRLRCAIKNVVLRIQAVKDGLYLYLSIFISNPSTVLVSPHKKLTGSQTRSGMTKVPIFVRKVFRNCQLYIETIRTKFSHRGCLILFCVGWSSRQISIQGPPRAS